MTKKGFKLARSGGQGIVRKAGSPSGLWGGLWEGGRAGGMGVWSG